MGTVAMLPLLQGTPAAELRAIRIGLEQRLDDARRNAPQRVDQLEIALRILQLDYLKLMRDKDARMHLIREYDVLISV